VSEVASSKLLPVVDALNMFTDRWGEGNRQKNARRDLKGWSNADRLAQSMTDHSQPSLAIFSGHPAFDKPLHVGRPNIGDRSRFLERVDDILDSHWLTNSGPYEQAFERRVREFCGVRECVATCNGTIALELLMRAVGMKGEVIVPSYTFVATAHALQWQEIRPVFCDVDPQTHTLDPVRVRELITPNTTGIVGVHLWGQPCDIDALEEIAQEHSLELIFDASHALGSTYHGKPIGGFGRAEVFSFHATKVLNTLEGGAIVTDDPALAEKLRLMRNFGFESKDQVVYLGSNGKMNEISAAMGLTGFDSLDDFIERNRVNFEDYRKQIEPLKGISFLPMPEGERGNYHYVVVVVDPERAGLTRDELIKVLEKENILARRYFYPGVHKMEPYRSGQPMAGLVLPVTDQLSATVMTLPTGQAVDSETIERIGGIVRMALANAESVRKRLAE
jgi:dTDP-4-amino-4,6-dideoxygalactose transaminase